MFTETHKQVFTSFHPLTVSFFNNHCSRITKFSQPHDLSLPQSSTKSPAAFFIWDTSLQRRHGTNYQKPGGNSDASLKGQGISAREKNKFFCPLSPYIHFLPWRRWMHVIWYFWLRFGWQEVILSELQHTYNRTTVYTVWHSFLCACRPYLLWHRSPGLEEWHFLIHPCQWWCSAPAWIWFSASLRCCSLIDWQPSAQGCKGKSGWLWLHGSRHQRSLDPGG